MRKFRFDRKSLIHLYFYPNIHFYSWQALFKELDSDDSGVIEFNELKAFLRGNNAEDLIPILDDWMGDYDVNGDGKLNYQEFLGFVCALNS